MRRSKFYDAEMWANFVARTAYGLLQREAEQEREKER